MQGNFNCEYKKKALALLLSTHNLPAQTAQVSTRALVRISSNNTTPFLPQHPHTISNQTTFPTKQPKHLSPASTRCSYLFTAFTHLIHPQHSTTPIQDQVSKEVSNYQPSFEMSTSAIYPGDSLGTSAMRTIAVPCLIDRLPMFDCVYAYEYYCVKKVERAGTKCRQCLVKTTEPSIVEMQSEG